MKKIILPVGFFLLLLACSKNSIDYTADCSTTKSYASDVSPVIQSYCATNSGCHGTGSSNGPGALTSYVLVYSARSSIRSAVASGSMPENSTLTAAQKNAIICWIDAGAADN